MRWYDTFSKGGQKVKKGWALVACLSIMVLGIAVHPVQAGSRTTLKIATLAPEGSSWMEALRKTDREIREKTQGRVRFKFYAGGVLGDETVIMTKIRLGQIDGALFSSGGLGLIYTELRVTEVPFIFNNYQEADYVMEKMTPFFQEGLAKSGFSLLGWSEGGFIYLMSNKPLARVADVKGLKVWLWGDAKIPRALFREAGLSPVPLNVPDVLVALQTRLVDVVYNSPLGAISMQWVTKIKYLTDLELAYALGGLVVKTKKFHKISPADRKTVREVVATHFKTLKQKVRQDNQEALQIMQQEGVKIVKPAPVEVEKFRKLAKRAIDKLDENAFSRATLSRVMELLREYRKQSS